MTASSYYDRTTTQFVDGSPIFHTPEDEQRQSSVAQELETAWGCNVKSFGRLAPVDWFFERDGRLIGVGELKVRQHEAGRYPTVFLNVRKWLALNLAQGGLGVPAIFVARFNDGTRWTRVSEIDASQVRIGGLTRQVKSRNDIEPVIEVPVHTMHPLND